MLGTGFELKQHTHFLPLSMPSFPIIPSASSISFSQFQTKNNAIELKVNKRRHSKSFFERQSAILQLSSSSSQSHFESALASSLNECNKMGR